MLGFNDPFYVIAVSLLAVLLPVFLMGTPQENAAMARGGE